MDHCTFHPDIGQVQPPFFSYVEDEEQHHQLQSYLEGQSYGSIGENDSVIRNAAEAVNYVNNL